MSPHLLGRPKGAWHSAVMEYMPALETLLIDGYRLSVWTYDSHNCVRINVNSMGAPSRSMYVHTKVFEERHYLTAHQVAKRVSGWLREIGLRRCEPFKYDWEEA